MWNSLTPPRTRRRATSSGRFRLWGQSREASARNAAGSPCTARGARRLETQHGVAVLVRQDSDSRVCNLERRRFLAQSVFGSGLGGAALSTLFAQDGIAAEGPTVLPHFTPRAKRVIYLFQ